MFCLILITVHIYIYLIYTHIHTHMGDSKNSGTPKWMVKIMVRNPMNKWMIWGETPPIF